MRRLICSFVICSFDEHQGRSDHHQQNLGLLFDSFIGMKKMRNLAFCTLPIIFFILGCKSGADPYQQQQTEKTIEAELDKRNRAVIPLLQRISKMPGIVDRAGAPIFQRVLNDRSRPISDKRPLYVINGYRLGNSFAQVESTITPTDVKEINTYFGADAASFGPLGAYGVIEIITY